MHEWLVAGAIPALAARSRALISGQCRAHARSGREPLPDRSRRSSRPPGSRRRCCRRPRAPRSRTRSDRFTSLQQLISAIGGATDQKASLDLNARIAAEQGMLQNEQTKLQVLYQVAQSAGVGPRAAPARAGDRRSGIAAAAAADGTVRAQRTVGFFAEFNAWLNALLAGYIGDNTARIAAALEPAIVTLGVIYVMVWGYLQLTGQIEEPFIAGVKRIITLAVILGCALHLWLYNTLIVDTFFNAPAQLGAVVVGAFDPVDDRRSDHLRGRGCGEPAAAKGRHPERQLRLLPGRHRRVSDRRAHRHLHDLSARALAHCALGAPGPGAALHRAAPL